MEGLTLEKSVSLLAKAVNLLLTKIVSLVSRRSPTNCLETN